MKTKIELKSTREGVIDQIFSNLSWILILAICFCLPIVCPDWFISKDKCSPWEFFGPILKWIIIICSPIALIVLLREFFEIIIYAPTYLLNIDNQNDVLIFTTFRKSFFGFSFQKSTIVHKLLSVDVTQAYFGRCYNTGALTITGSTYNNTETNEYTFVIEGISDPFAMKNMVQETLPTANDKLNIKQN